MILITHRNCRAANKDAVLLGEDAEELQILRRNLLGAHVTRHALALVHALRSQAAPDGSTVAEVFVGTVRVLHALHVVAFETIRCGQINRRFGSWFARWPRILNVRFIV